MRDGDMTTKRDGELLAELLDIPKAVFETHTLREIMTAPQAIKGIGEKRKKNPHAEGAFPALVHDTESPAED